ncbi:uroporphyrinogen-III synthase [Testudinibacter sp. TR-2022]|uniref:uroporphyrinogen-III synthase n=1 Tax=Testudinibacter sp. TR-2022 TaxID=2585029 RepID=UPI001118EFDB|nr:uroporphyrinogen-III synthase [Testudinibacter sp. TR-2022]TNH05092.1 uroporphyrinogen-III synthase [Pasteurellaceae bacterium Phil31]TNH08964.1 uroporphyrinogen-III synthase [Testudinibacter sp. TR-2022]TNH10641.1 uroporphyrinogen-III synthase [Testudinibacter sp. TR-2022]TNH17183.1 uroporphyrinogen-III synthase [Testudinibacter sp. TR-2022]TNH20745.1 uroporphyrinogen-III synthase [Testudinibacter sp. TR-2022]
MAVLITRPQPNGETLCKLLNQQGFATLYTPLFNIEKGRELNQLPAQLQNLPTGSLVFAVSKNAINYANQVLHNVGAHWRSDLHYFSVGRRSAEYFTALSEQPVLYPYPNETSEGLLCLPQMQDLSDKKILVLRGNGGRELFRQQAEARGGTVEVIECYQRIAKEYDNIEQISVWKRAGINTIVVTSNEILRYLVEFVPKNDHNWLMQCHLISISRRITQLAKEYGWSQISQTARADNASICETLLVLKNGY